MAETQRTASSETQHYSGTVGKRLEDGTLVLSSTVDPSEGEELATPAPDTETGDEYPDTPGEDDTTNETTRTTEPSEDDTETSGKYDDLTKDELEEEAGKRGLSKSGNKEDLKARLEENDNQQ